MFHLRSLFFSIALLISYQCRGMILHDGQGYKVFDGQNFRAVKPYDIDPMLRKMKIDQFKQFIHAGCRIRASKLDNGDYVLRAYVPGNGGGAIGAVVGAAIGKAGTHIVCHGAIAGVAGLVSLANPIVGTGLGIALEGIFGGPIEVLSITMALAGGIAGGTLTGPV